MFSQLVGSAGAVYPEILLILAGCLYFVGALISNRDQLWASVSVVALLGAAGLAYSVAGPAESAGLFRNDAFSQFTRVLGLASGLGLVLISWGRVPHRYAAEYYGSLLFIVAGVNLVGASNDLVTMFLALELVSIPTYLILYIVRYSDETQEATTKYFILSVFSSALLLYGLSFLYGAVGSTNLSLIRAAFHAEDITVLPGTLTVALVMIVAGLGFRVTAAPFHFYAPDVYTGAPLLPVTLLSIVPKIAGFAAFYQLISATLLPVNAENTTLHSNTTDLLWILALLSMLIGNMLGLLQDNIKRMLAYSGVAHAGYMLVGLGAGVLPGRAGSGESPFAGETAVFFYLAIYTAMTFGAFAVLTYVSTFKRRIELVDDLAGLARSHPLVALAMAAFLFSLTGLPPTAGFWGKLYVFFAAWTADRFSYKILALLMAINAAIGAWYYLRIIAVMYLRQPVKPLEPETNLPGLLAIALAALVTVGLFIWQSSAWSWSALAVGAASLN